MRCFFAIVLILFSANLLCAADAAKTAPSVATEPTKVLRDWEALKYGMFIHFGMSTFVGDQFGRIPSPSTAFAPTDLDEEQWARTAKEAGMKYMVLTVKHHYGHALWPSAYSDYTVATSSYKFDVTKRFVAACRKHDLKPGFYYSLGWDSRHMKKMKPDEYEQFVHNQIKELLTNYGPITMLWFDIPWDMGPDMSGSLARLYAHCKSLQPDCLILLNQGFVDGSFVEKRRPSYFGKDVSQTPVSIWPKDISNGERVSPPPSGHNPRIVYEGKQYYLPDEVDDCIGQQRWFWGLGDGVRPARQMYELYKQSVGRGSNLLLNAGPDKTGQIPAEMVQRLREIAQMIAHPESVQDSLLVGRPAKASNIYRGEPDNWGPQRAVDMDIGAEAGTRWATDENVKTAWLEVDLGGQKTFDRATLNDALDRVRAFEIQIPDGQGGWKAIYQGKAVGGLGVDITFPKVTADRVRLTITDSIGGPSIWDFAIYPASTTQAAGAESKATKNVDHRYFSWDSWIGAIGLPDDCFKSVADADGAFWTENRLNDFRYAFYPNPPKQHAVMVQADLLGGTKRMDQKMLSPHVPISTCEKQQDKIAIRETLFLARPLDWSATRKGEALKGRNTVPQPRQYLLMVEYANQGDKPAEIAPVLNLIGAAPAVKLSESTAFSLAANTQCRSTLPIESFQGEGNNRYRATLNKMTLAPGEKAQWVLTVNRNDYADDKAVGWSEAEKLLAQAVAYWEKSTGLPYAVIEVPDPEIQALLDTSIRELYQMRYVINDLPAFFFGPWCYNDYWILDGSFVTEAMAMLGRLDDASGYTDYLLLNQKEDGRIQCIDTHWKETGIAIYTLYRHARMIQDKDWLRKRWPQICRAVKAIEQLRRKSDDPKALNYRLSPVGFGDGGIGQESEYTNNHWLLAGMNAAVEAANWLGKTEDAEAWEKEYRDYQEVFQKAIARDAKTDAHGNRYIPVIMGLKVPEHPTRGQWAFCQGVYPGRIFAKDDPLMLGTMNMLAAHELQDGIVEDSGWIAVWPQCGSFYGHDWLWLGDGQKAAKLLYAFANHSSPVCNWREEMPKQTKPGERFPYSKQLGGDMPHVSAAAEFIRLAAHLLAFDRGQELHLLEGLPKQWLNPGMTTRLNGLVTPFGPLNMELKVAPDGKTAALNISPLKDSECKKIVVHVGGWASADPGAVQELAPAKSHELTLTLVPK